MTSADLAEGWKEIAAALGVSERTAQDWAKRPVDPIPVRVSHRGPYSHRTALRDWIFRQDMSFQAARLLRESARDCARLREQLEKATNRRRSA